MAVGNKFTQNPSLPTTVAAHSKWGRVIYCSNSEIPTSSPVRDTDVSLFVCVLLFCVGVGFLMGRSAGQKTYQMSKEIFFYRINSESELANSKDNINARLHCTSYTIFLLLPTWNFNGESLRTGILLLFYSLFLSIFNVAS